MSDIETAVKVTLIMLLFVALLVIGTIVIVVDISIRTDNIKALLDKQDSINEVLNTHYEWIEYNRRLRIGYVSDKVKAHVDSLYQADSLYQLNPLYKINKIVSK